MASIEEMARKGKENYAAKKEAMVRSYQAADMGAGYDATPFGPTRKANYKSAIGRMKQHYNSSRLDDDKWYRNWVKKMSQ